jgi:hypothetical protein
MQVATLHYNIMDFNLFYYKPFKQAGFIVT